MSYCSRGNAQQRGNPNFNTFARVNTGGVGAISSNPVLKIRALRALVGGRAGAVLLGSIEGSSNLGFRWSSTSVSAIPPALWSARADHEQLARSFGPTIGPQLGVLGLGGDDSPIVDEPHVARGRSKEETFTTDVADATSIAANVERLAREVTTEVVADGRRVTHVAVKVRTSNFFTRTKISKLPAPTIDPNDVAVMATAVLARFGELRPVRLLCVRVVLEIPPQQ